MTNFKVLHFISERNPSLIITNSHRMQRKVKITYLISYDDEVTMLSFRFESNKFD